MLERLLTTQLEAAMAHTEAAEAALRASRAAIAAAMAIASFQGQQAAADPTPPKIADSDPEICEHPENMRKELPTMGGKVSVMCLACGETLN
jgi:histidine ammonia-lyase